MRRRLLAVFAALGIAAAAVIAAFAAADIRTDMTAFLPPGKTAAAQFLFRELQSGTAATIILIGIEGAEPEALARASAGMAGELRSSGLFAFVNNGDFSTEGSGGGQEFLFRNRYLLSTATTPDAFTADALRADLRKLLDGLTSSAAPLVKRFGFADPVGAFLQVVQTWIGGSHVEQRFGVWFAPEGGRALLIAKTKAGGLDIAAQETAAAAIRAAFEHVRPAPGARLLVSGPAVFATEAAHAIRADTHLISIASALLLAAFLLWQYRSVFVVAVLAVPLGLSIAAAVAVVQLAFGFVHGITLGFGMTMLGVTVDYPILLLTLRRPGETSGEAVVRIWPTMVLAAASAALGLTGMLLSSFPGLSQLGLFSVTGVLVAAAATRWVLPALIAAAGVGPVERHPSWLKRAAAARRHPAVFAIPVALAALLLLWRGGPAWESDLANLSPVPQEKRDLDAELRRQVGAPDVRHLIAVGGDDAEAVLRRAEAFDPVLRRLTEQGAIAGAEIASRFLPSARTQLARRAALPAPDELRERLRTAGEGMPFRDNAFDPFVADIDAARGMAPVTRDHVKAPIMAARIDSLLFERGGGWYGLIALVDVKGPDAVARAVAAENDPALTYIDVKAETDRIVAASTREVWRWLAGGALAVVVLLAVGLRDSRRALRVAGPVAGALVATLAILSLAGARLTLFHLVSLLLMVGVSIDYGLFFNRQESSAADAQRTLHSIVNCNVATLLTFGLLALCRTPILRSIGMTVATGVLCAIVLAFVFAQPRPRSTAAGQ